MREQTVAMYCFLDDLLTHTRPAWARPADPRRRLSDAEVLTTALVAARYFGGNLVLGRHYMEQHWGMKSLDKSGFTRHLHRLADTLLGLFATFGQALKALHTEARYVIDSFPVAVCQNIRIGRNRLLGHEAYRGRCASKRLWFYGFKMQIVATTDGIPVDFYVHAGSEAGITGLRHLAPDLPEGSVRYTDAGYTDAGYTDAGYTDAGYTDAGYTDAGYTDAGYTDAGYTDAGYTDYGWEDLFEEASGNRQQTARKSNSTRPHAPHETFLLQHFRKTIETTFSQLTARFPKQIHAVTAQGFVLKIALFIFVHTLDQVGL